MATWASAELVLLLATASPAQTAPAAPPTGCTAPEAGQLDFWVGAWNVYPNGAPAHLVAHSRIERMFGGCVIRETWTPLTGASGGSYSAWRPELGAWRQTWVDASGSWVEFKGGLQGRAMVLTGVWPQPGKPDQITRMTYRPLDGGAVEQVGETSDDGGRTWAASFDFIYRPAA